MFRLDKLLNLPEDEAKIFLLRREKMTKSALKIALSLLAGALLLFIIFCMHPVAPHM